MRLDVHVVDVQPTAALKEYTQGRLWLGLQHHARHIVCAGVWLTECSGAAGGENRRVLCRIDLWLRRIGPVTVRHVDDNPYVAVDLAVARVRQAVSRRVRRALRAAGVAADADAWRDDGEPERRWRRPRFQREPAPRLAVVIESPRRCAASSARLEHARAEPAPSHWLAHRVWEDDGGRHRAGSHVTPARQRRPSRRRRQRRELASCA